MYTILDAFYNTSLTTCIIWLNPPNLNDTEIVQLSFNFTLVVTLLRMQHLCLRYWYRAGVIKQVNATTKFLFTWTIILAKELQVKYDKWFIKQRKGYSEMIYCILNIRQGY